ncbi:uncharacterized protein LOC115734495 isoform X1 [Rhodamnia argentea]|uniref:Uncharacterized protein LOC115734495 isoform X1 n=1 Tax=Rhodamnia argentea TaxID=178133 RepID=A0A8B8NFD3_9MYRT|nr:uncharacterized protein LOC115734495 isoform X1 [Rhodamnia argentea]XP_048137142.1 uncharacterized protein LOC115734495 isoform X1 [Rhodamnia argentea]XP_048137143.1 uncharacterized protein LOC115734495 isoform X1 [Rhodamnia argentea]
MSSSLDLLAPSLETVETTKEIIIVPVDASPFEISTGEKRKREGGRVRSRVWQHFSKLEKRPGEREECRCNYCGNLYVCSSKSGTTHLNRHIFEGGCPKYKPALSEMQNLTSYPKDDLDDDNNITPLRVNTEDSTRNFSEQEVAENFASELVQLKEENTKLLHERDDLAAQKTNLEQLIVTMASETARLMEENTKLKEECSRLQEERHKTVTREEFVRLETQVSKLREDFERDRRVFPAATMAALAHFQKGR